MENRLKIFRFPNSLLFYRTSENNFQKLFSKNSFKNYFLKQLPNRVKSYDVHKNVHNGAHKMNNVLVMVKEGWWSQILYL